jgi:4'-phosphopantetheinyl transferase EntD
LAFVLSILVINSIKELDLLIFSAEEESFKEVIPRNQKAKDFDKHDVLLKTSIRLIVLLFVEEQLL